MWSLNRKIEMCLFILKIKLFITFSNLTIALFSTGWYFLCFQIYFLTCTILTLLFNSNVFSNTWSIPKQCNRTDIDVSYLSNRWHKFLNLPWKWNVFSCIDIHSRNCRVNDRPRSSRRRHKMMDHSLREKKSFNEFYK